jgi:hypothetical protein
MKVNTKNIQVGILFIIVAFVKWNMMREMLHTSGSWGGVAFYVILRVFPVDVKLLFLARGFGYSRIHASEKIGFFEADGFLDVAQEAQEGG